MRKTIFAFAATLAMILSACGPQAPAYCADVGKFYGTMANVAAEVSDKGNFTVFFREYSTGQDFSRQTGYTTTVQFGYLKPHYRERPDSFFIFYATAPQFSSDRTKSLCGAAQRVKGRFGLNDLPGGNSESASAAYERIGTLIRALSLEDWELEVTDYGSGVPLLGTSRYYASLFIVDPDKAIQDETAERYGPRGEFVVATVSAETLEDALGMLTAAISSQKISK